MLFTDVTYVVVKHRSLWQSIENGVWIALIAGLIVAILVAAFRYWWKELLVQVREANRQLVPNGGSSLRDAVNRLEEQGNRLEAGQAQIKKKQSKQALEIVALREGWRRK